jgi:recombinational DNA repair protein RecR
LNKKESETIKILKGRIKHLQAELARAQAKLMDYEENRTNMNVKRVEQLESENIVLKELLSKYENINLDHYDQLVKENKELKERLKKLEEKEMIMENRDSTDSWFINNLKSQMRNPQK